MIMIVSKVIYDKSRNICTLQNNQMECKICSYLNWEPMMPSYAKRIAGVTCSSVLLSDPQGVGQPCYTSWVMCVPVSNATPTPRQYFNCNVVSKWLDFLSLWISRFRCRLPVWRLRPSLVFSAIYCLAWRWCASKFNVPFVVLAPLQYLRARTLEQNSPLQ